MSGESNDTDERIRKADARGVSPLVGVLALLAITVCLATVVAAGVGTLSLESSDPTATFELSADGDESRITIAHVAGDAIDVDALSVVIAVNDRELSNQPPVPFVGATGFDGTPDGPFNEKDESKWRPGERASLVVAGTNAPALTSGDSVTVTLAVDGRRLARLETTAR